MGTWFCAVPVDMSQVVEGLRTFRSQGKKELDTYVNTVEYLKQGKNRYPIGRIKGGSRNNSREA